MAYWRSTGVSLATGNFIDDTGATGIPSAGDDLEFGPAMTAAVAAGLTDLAAIHLANVFFRPGHLAVGLVGTYAQLYCDSIDDTGGGSAASYIVIMNPSTACKVSMNNGPISSGVLGLAGKVDLTRGVFNGNLNIARDPGYLTSSIVTTVSALAVIKGQTGVVIEANVTVNGGTITGGGNVTTSSNAGDWNNVSGTLTTAGAATAGTVKNTGVFNHGSTGNITLIENRAPGSVSRSANKYLPYTLGQLKMEGNTSVDLGGRVILTNPTEMLTPGYPMALPTGATLTITLP